jgi:hypothetical protein
MFKILKRKTIIIGLKLKMLSLKLIPERIRLKKKLGELDCKLVSIKLKGKSIGIH